MKRTYLILLLAGILTASCASTSSNEMVSVAQPVAVSSAGLQLHQAMRDLWADHVIWTRDYIIAATSDNPSSQTVLARLMRNQEDLGNAMVPYYGADAGKRLTDLLKDHISIAGELVTAAKAQDNAKVTGADTRWHQNADAIATFLSGANPNWSKSALVSMLNEHLALTSKEATLRLQKNWSEDTTNFDRIFDNSMMMADALSDGVIKQFPAGF